MMCAAERPARRRAAGVAPLMTKHRWLLHSRSSQLAQPGRTGVLRRPAERPRACRAAVLPDPGAILLARSERSSATARPFECRLVRLNLDNVLVRLDLAQAAGSLPVRQRTCGSIY
jgi:hypothetical protein